MKLSGLNSIGFPATQKQSQKPSSEKDASSSFEDVLGKAANKSEARGQKPETRGPNAEPGTREQAAGRGRPEQNPSQNQSQNQNQSSAQSNTAPSNNPAARTASESKNLTPSNEAEANMLPNQPSAPSLNGPVNDRIMSGAPIAEPALTAPGLKQKSLLPQDEGVDSLTRRVVWNDFLRKMKDELGVSAEDVLSAFASLSDEELSQPPQATVDKVVAALGLNGQQADLAKNYFSELVSKTKSRSMGEELSTSHRQINLTLMSQREAQRKSLSRTLDQMNQNFFMKNPQMAQGAAQAVPQNIPQDQRAAPMMGMEMVEITAPTAASAAALPGAALPQAGSPITAEMAASAPFKPLMEKLEKMTPSEKNTVDELVRQFLSPQAKMQTLKAGEMSAAPIVAAQAGGTSALGADSAAASAAAGSMSAGSLKGILQDLSASLEGEDDGEYTSDASYLTAGLAGESKVAGLNGPNPEFQAELAKAAKEPMAVADLVDKAQIMVHEGGGEMKVTLSPDGLGEVAMRVSVNDGKVQVQMITESDEAKRLIERQLGELKGQLHNNNLQLDTIKIDTATNLGKQLEQQYQDAQRQATHNAMEQFRQDNQGWRRSFFEMPSAKLYKGQGEAPRDVQAPTASSARKNINRRLDLVA